MKPAPSYSNAPDAINPSAMKLWRHTVKVHADTIYESKDLAQQWKSAKGNFERLCKIKGIPPYVDVLEALAVRLAILVERM